MARGEFPKALLGGWVLLVGVLGACHDGDNVKSLHATAVFDEAALDFGEVPVGEWREKEITVRNVGHVPFSLVEALELEGNPSFVVVAGRERITSGETRKVKVRFRPLKEGELTTSVAVTTDARDKPTDPVPVRGVGIPTPIGVEPNILDFETLEVDSDRTLEVTVRNPVDLPLTVSIEGQDKGEFAVDMFTVPPNSTHTLKTRFAPTTVGERAAQIKVLSCPDCTPTHVEMGGRSVPSAFEFKPSPVPFAETAVHDKTQSWTKLTNVTWRPVTIGELLVSDVSFTPLQDLAARTVQPGETVHLDMEFAARFSGPNVGHMDVKYRSDRDREARVVLDARGGQPQLALTPIAMDFGNIPVGGKGAQTVRITNAGSNGDLHLVGVRGEGHVEHFGVGNPVKTTGAHAWSGGAWPQLLAPEIPVSPGADYIDVPIYFQPTAAGAFEARIIIQSDGVPNAEREVRVKGTAYDTGVCSWRVVPEPLLDFGNVPVGTEAILGFRFENAGTNICAVKDIHISNDGGGVFRMPGGALTGGVVLQDDAFSAMIAFRAGAAGEFNGELSITVNDPAMPVIKYPLKAFAGTSCLVATPSPVDFGPIRYDCSPEPKKVYISNACATPATVLNYGVGPGTSTQFALQNAPPPPITLQPGEGFEIEVTYSRTVLGQHYSPLFVEVMGEPVRFMVPLWAETNHEGRAVDRFVQGQANELDVLFVMGNTTTMGPYQQRLREAIPGWIQSATSQGTSLQIGVTTTGLVERSPTCGGGANGGEAGRLFPVDGSRERIVQGTAARVPTVQQNLDVGVCHNLAQGLENMRMALSTPLVDQMDDPRTPQPNDGNKGFVRPSARMAVVFVSDEDDHSGFDPSSYIQFLRTLKGPNQSHRAQAYAIVPDGSCSNTAGPNATRYIRVAQDTGGTVARVCATSYASLLDQVLQRAAGPQRDFRLSFPVGDATNIIVRVNGKTVADTAWTYDASNNAVVFEPSSVPLPGQTVEVRYVSQCGTVTQ